MKQYLCIGLLLFGLQAQAQTVIHGRVTDAESKKGLTGISVVLHEKGNPAIVQYALTRNDGNYRLEYRGTKDSLLILASGFNMSKESKMVANRNQELNFSIREEAIALKEASVRASKITQRGDTIKYAVEGYVQQNDRAISDVLQRLPGIEVLNSGQIKYNNKPINKFYIEGTDMLQGRYGLATKNIQAKDVASVEVLENHQPIEALRDKEFSEDAAVNITLKDAAKGVWTINGLAGLGLSPLLWKAELTAMNFAKGRQDILTYKGNNTGDNVANDFVRFYVSGGLDFSNNDQSSLSVQSPNPPSISQKRHLLNEVQSVSVNSTRALKNDYKFTLNANYIHDRQDRSSYARTEYFLPDETLLSIEEQIYARSKIDQLSADVQIETNKPKYYLNNSLKFSGNWNSEWGYAKNPDSVYQYLHKPNYSIGNTFRLIRNYPKTALNFMSVNSYSSAPQYLRVTPQLYPQLFPESFDGQELLQEHELNKFSSQNTLSFALDHKNFRQSYNIGFLADIQDLDTRLLALRQGGQSTAPIDSLSNDLLWQRYQLSVRPTYSYNYGKIRTSLNLPLSYNYLNIKDPLDPRQEHKLFFSPSMNLTLILSAKWESSFSLSYGSSMGGLSQATRGFIMHSYRSLQRNEGEMLEQQMQNYRWNLYYKNAIKALFVTLTATYFDQHSNLLYGSQYDGMLTIRTAYEIPNSSKGLNLQANISKGFDFIASTLTAGAGYTNSKGVQRIQDQLMDYKGQSYSLNGGIETKLTSWMNVAYKANFSESRNSLSLRQTEIVPIRSLSQSAKLNVFPMEGLAINFNYEHFHNSSIVQGNRNISFGDIGLSYRRKRMEYMLNYTNVFNEKEFISASNSSTGSYFYAYGLRPAEIMFTLRFKLK
jgi:hypothetical protein